MNRYYAPISQTKSKWRLTHKWRWRQHQQHHMGRTGRNKLQQCSLRWTAYGQKKQCGATQMEIWPAGEARMRELHRIKLNDRELTEWIWRRRSTQEYKKKSSRLSSLPLALARSPHTCTLVMGVKRAAFNIIFWLALNFAVCNACPFRFVSFGSAKVSLGFPLLLADTLLIAASPISIIKYRYAFQWSQCCRTPRLHLINCTYSFMCVLDIKVKYSNFGLFPLANVYSTRIAPVYSHEISNFQTSKAPATTPTTTNSYIFILVPMFNAECFALEIIGII